LTTLAEICLQTARMLGEVMDGVATGGSSSGLIDTVNLTQSSGFWDGGVLWILSGTHAGKMVSVLSFSGNKLTIDDLGSSVSGATYAVSRGQYPLRILKMGINSALGATRRVDLDISLSVSDEDQVSLPASIGEVVGLEIDEDGEISINTHYEVKDGVLYLGSDQSGTLRIQHLTSHSALSTDSAEVPVEINLEWLRWAALVHILRWGMRNLQNDPVYDVGEFLNEAYKRVERLKPTRQVILRLRTA